MLFHPDPRWLQQVQPGAHVPGQMGNAGVPAPWGQLWSMQSAMMPAYQAYYGLNVPRPAVGLAPQVGSHLGGPAVSTGFNPGAPSPAFNHGQTAAVVPMQAWGQHRPNPPSSQIPPQSVQQPPSEQSSTEYQVVQQGPPN